MSLAMLNGRRWRRRWFACDVPTRSPARNRGEVRILWTVAPALAVPLVAAASRALLALGREGRRRPIQIPTGGNHGDGGLDV